MLTVGTVPKPNHWLHDSIGSGQDVALHVAPRQALRWLRIPLQRQHWLLHVLHRYQRYVGVTTNSQEMTELTVLHAPDCHLAHSLGAYKGLLLSARQRRHLVASSSCLPRTLSVHGAMHTSSHTIIAPRLAGMLRRDHRAPRLLSNPPFGPFESTCTTT